MDTEYRRERNPRHGESTHLFLLGVAESAAGCGVAQELVSDHLFRVRPGGCADSGLRFHGVRRKP
jgi:hypothetical protein